MKPSPFLTRPRILENELAFTIEDAFPVTLGHCLVIPKRVFADYREATSEEKNKLWELVDSIIKLQTEKHNISDFNIGLNLGENAGQTIAHMHIHVIPRRKGDVGNPRGGVRGVIPEKQDY